MAKAKRQAARALTLDEWEVVQNAALTTTVMDWVMVNRDISPQAQVLYMNLCRLAQLFDEENGVRISIDAKEIDVYARGVGQEAIEELTGIGAVTVVARYESGLVRYQVEQYPPDIKEWLKQFIHHDGLPMVSYV